MSVYYLIEKLISLATILQTSGTDFYNMVYAFLWEERGRTGGSIMHSHAFDHGNVKDLYQKRYAENPIKDHVKSILWKEGLYLANHLRKHNVDPLYLIKQQKN